uniref:Uncharacterized protein n=1 Tax=Rhizophora mucronata TaxID=61149 RepID=A0A2P2NLW3_RHIMU
MIFLLQIQEWHKLMKMAVYCVLAFLLLF